MTKSKKGEMGGTCSAHGRNEHKILVGKPKEKIPIQRWEDNIKMYITEIGCEGMDWINLAWNRVQWRALVNMVMNLRVP
jgi:hypothetical protein